MNIKKQAQKLEQLLEDELKTKVPLLPLKDGSIVYKTYKIKKDNNNNWNLTHFKGDLVDTFNLKASAILAAKYHNSNQLTHYNHVKNLDIKYWTNSNDAYIFNKKFKTSKDITKKMIYVSRYELTNSRAVHCKQEIISLFTHNF